MTKAERQLIAEWDAKLAAEGLTPDRASVKHGRVRLTENRLVVCGACIGFHTYEAGCSLYSEDN